MADRSDLTGGMNMKRHLMTVLALCAGMAVLTAVGETYEKGKVYGPIV